MNRTKPTRTICFLSELSKPRKNNKILIKKSLLENNFSISSKVFHSFAECDVAWIILKMWGGVGVGGI